MRDDDTAETLAARVLAVEHRIYPLALKLVAQGRVRIVDGRCIVEGGAASDDFLMAPAIELPSLLGTIVASPTRSRTMITLYAFGPQFSLPDPSPFVTKAEVLLKMAKLPYEIDLKGFRKAPKGKLPYIKDDGELIADFNLHPPPSRDQAQDRFRPRAFRRAESDRLGVREAGGG